MLAVHERCVDDLVREAIAFHGRRLRRLAEARLLKIDVVTVDPAWLAYSPARVRCEGGGEGVITGGRGARATQRGVRIRPERAGLIRPSSTTTVPFTIT